MERMRAARNNSKDESRTTHKASETKGKKPMRSGKVSETTTKPPPTNINDQNAGSEVLTENASKQTTTQSDSLTTFPSEPAETTDSRGSITSDQKQKDTIEGFIAWDED